VGQKKGEEMTPTQSTVFDQLKAGLQDSVGFSRGKLSLITTDLPSPPPRPSPAEIAELRNTLRMSQAVFAAVINVSAKTVQSWEQGARQPSHAALRMLELIRDDPGVADSILRRRPQPRAGVSTQ
jgi:putative transcriptional regulator